jgi:serine/threonine protein phosphatase PrpC
MVLIAYADTHTGGRSSNEDWYRLDAALGLFVVADGMGGTAGGARASRLAADAVDTFYRDPPDDAPDPATGCCMGEAFRRANEAVRRHRVGALAKMGSTLTALAIRDGRATIGHVGDSRAYRLRAGRLERLTADHSLVAALESAGITSLVIHSRFGHVVTRAIGLAESAFPDIVYERVEVGDRFVLCTDGLTGSLEDERIERVVGTLPASEAATALVEEALRRGAEDNVTALVVEVRLPANARAERPAAAPQSVAADPAL